MSAAFTERDHCQSGRSISAAVLLIAAGSVKASVERRLQSLCPSVHLSPLGLPRRGDEDKGCDAGASGGSDGTSVLKATSIHL